MKIRKMVKKTMAAGMLALMACTSMSAMAEKQWGWEYVSGLHFNVHYRTTTIEHNGDERSFDEACYAYASQYYRQGQGTCIDEKTNCHIYSKGLNKPLSFSIGGTIKCSSQLGSFLFNTKQCPEGTYIRAEGENGLGAYGCWRKIDCDPSLYTRGVVPEACNPEPEPDPCEGKHVIYDEEGKLQYDYGGQVCVNNVIVKACAWPQNFLEKNQKAQDIIKECVLRHEDQHMRERGFQECREDGRAGWRSNNGPFECDGYIKEAQCLNEKSEKNACDGDAECQAQIESRLEWVFNRMGDGRTCGIGGTGNGNDKIYSGYRYYMSGNVVKPF